jgi:hypothetical protein
MSKIFLRRLVLRPLLLSALVLAGGTGLAAENLIRNGDFRAGLAGWSGFWSRTPGGQAAVDATVRREGRNTLRVEHTGQRDWSVAQERRLDVRPGQIYELSAWARLEGSGDASLSVTLYDPRGEVIDWLFAARSTRVTTEWRRLRARFVVPAGAGAILPRLTGNGSSRAWFDDVRLVRTGSLDALRRGGLPRQLRLANDAIELTWHTDTATFSVVDRRGGRAWRQRPGAPLAVLDARQVDRSAEGRELPDLALRLLDPATMRELKVAVRLEPRRPEAIVALQGSGEMQAPLAFPPPFGTQEGDLLVMPVNEGISYPVDDPTLGPMYYHLYGGHGLCMGWWGVTDGRRGMMAIVETPDDDAVEVPRLDGRLCLAPLWVPQKGQFGPTRRVRYAWFDEGGYVAMCKRYRQHARHAGLLKTLAEKRKENPNVDRLVGAANIWCFDDDGPGVCRELQAAGIRRILWSSAQKPAAIDRLNAMGVLASRYDIYQDLMDPANLPKLRGVHGDWTQAGWPDDITLGPDGHWISGWRVTGKDGRLYPCAVLCDSRALDYARRRIPAELKTHPYRCRFIDTTTAAPWNECYDPRHPMTRTESKRFKMELLEFVSRDCGLVTGSETGHEAAVPYLHYFEGMLSLGPYRVNDAGNDMQRIVQEVPEQVAKFQTGHRYRLPLWELVYHDCVVAQWYWGDYNNKLPAVWDRRDLWNALYGTPPMFMFDRKLWAAQRERFVRSYRAATPVARATGYVEMLSHRWLTGDHAVQETRFANELTVTVNFGSQPYRLPDGELLPAMSQKVKQPGGP